MLPTKLLKTFTNNNQIQSNPKNNPQATCDFFFNQLILYFTWLSSCFAEKLYIDLLLCGAGIHITKDYKQCFYDCMICK